MVTPPGSYALSIDGDFELGGFVFKGGQPLLHTDGGPAYHNTALGGDALISLTPGSLYGSRNTAVGSEALRNNTEGWTNTATGAYALYANTTGYNNTANGTYALSTNTTGSGNTAQGNYALFANTTGYLNTATGVVALRKNTSGYRNTATGVSALDNNTEGHSNTATGMSAMRQNTTGNNNAAVGFDAVRNNTTGSYNTAIGIRAGRFWTTGNHNIAIGSGTDGVNSDSGVIRIGGGNNQSATFIEGIHNAVLSGGSEHQVCVDDNDQLGACSPSSGRFKRDIRAMEEASAGIEALRPVVFRYRPEVKADADAEQFGLIAEEVAEIYPHLVSIDAEGRPLAVRYDLLTPLLLNELQRAQAEIEAQREEIATLRRDVLARLQRLESAKPSLR